jgi:hypothetical protein
MLRRIGAVTAFEAGIGAWQVDRSRVCRSIAVGFAGANTVAASPGVGAARATPPVTKRQSNRPDRRFAAAGSLPAGELQRLAQLLRYEGDPRHKVSPGDYGFVPPVNPRPTKSACDDLGPVLLGQALALFRSGVAAGMVSPFAPGSTPKYVWAVDAAGEVYEAKTKPPGIVYHGYRLGDDERDMRRYILVEWRRRCAQP